MSICRPLWLLLLIILLVGCSERDRPLESPVTLEGEVFGTFYQVSIADPLTRREADELEAGILAELEAVDAAMSTWRDDSELMALNEAPLGEWQPLSDALIEVLAIGQAVAKASDGAFDMTIGGLVNLWSFGPEARPREVPSEATLSARLAEIGPDSLEVDEQAFQARRLRDVFVDLSAVAKGHATDRVAAYLTQQELDHYLVNLGGEVKVAGHRDAESAPWRIGIEIPRDGPQEARHVLALEDIAVATSGDYRNYFEHDGQRYSHTLDPRTGRPIDHRLASVTVIHPSDAWADAWATALLVLGEEEGMALARQRELAVLMLVRQGEGWASLASPAFADHFGRETVDELGATVVDGPASGMAAEAGRPLE
ncbi:FAD:protein FMN transferase [Halomonas lysinitropha]|uniref:FAD:protein FMN transferase n=1 Tax=Halomonas lysinitropha TaxID=2607506 RepID=A0A5K1HYH5_9GAMM|nr:FAD:protein FMN transferase [Halomonas lysinitropha]VVZ94256.1 Thiamine biosynthesis lipoprotein ApbE precursor [Halomonas lysinitropha]